MHPDRRHEWIDLIPALGLVVGSALALTFALAVSGTASHIAYALVGGAAAGLLIALVVQLRRRT